MAGPNRPLAISWLQDGAVVELRDRDNQPYVVRWMPRAWISPVAMPFCRRGAV